MKPPISQSPPSRLEDPEASRRKSGRTRRRGKDKAPATADEFVPPFAARSTAIEAEGGKMKGERKLPSLSFPHPFFPPAAQIVVLAAKGRTAERRWLVASLGLAAPMD